jgi:ferredoxin
MAYVIVETCTKDNECVEACPVDCIHPKTNEPDWKEAAQLFVQPDECIDCGACVPVCPTDSIHPLAEVPAEQMGAIARNAAYFGLN